MSRPSLRPAIGLVAVLVVVVGCAGPTVSPSSSSPPSTVPSPSAVVTPIPPTIRPTAAPPSNPASEPPASPSTAWPSVPEAPVADAGGTLLLMHVRWGDTGPRAAILTVLANGRVGVMRPSEDGLGSVLLARQISDAGLTSVRAALVDVGLFDRDRTRELIKPLRCCGAGDQLRVRLGDETVTVGRVLAFPENYAPDERWDRFDVLVEKMRDLDGWLGDDAWSDRDWSPYHAATFCLALDRTGGDRRSVDGDTLAWPPGVRPFTSFGEPGWEGSSLRTGLIDADEAYAFASSIAVAANAAGIPRGGRYPIPFEEGGTRFSSPAVRVGDDQWSFGLEPLPPRSGDCTLAWG